MTITNHLRSDFIKTRVLKHDFNGFKFYKRFHSDSIFELIKRK